MVGQNCQIVELMTEILCPICVRMLEEVVDQFIAYIENQRFIAGEHAGIHTGHPVHLHHILHAASLFLLGEQRGDRVIFEFGDGDRELIVAQCLAEESGQGLICLF